MVLSPWADLRTTPPRAPTDIKPRSRVWEKPLQGFYPAKGSSERCAGVWCHESNSNKAIPRRWHWPHGTAVSQQLRAGHPHTKPRGKPAAPYIWAVKKQTKKSNTSNQNNTNKNSTKFLPLKPQQSFNATPPNTSTIQKFSYSTN